MTITIIPAGYRATIYSWENDADNNSTTVIEGLTKARVEFIIELCDLFKSRHTFGECQYFGNMYESNHYELSIAAHAICEVMEKHRSVLDKEEIEILNLNPLDDSNELTHSLSEMVSTYLDSSECYNFRVFDSAKIEYIPHEIRIENVTNQFFP